MAELLEAAPNALNPIEIESTSTAEASTITILKQAIVDPAKLSKKPVWLRSCQHTRQSGPQKLYTNTKPPLEQKKQ